MKNYRYPMPGAALLSLAAAAIAGAGTLVISPAAVAQEAARTPDEITVFARKRTETLQDVPATVTVFTENDIERNGVNRAADFIALTPGVSLVDAAEVGDTQVNIRGLNGARDAENNYALVIDGVTYTNPAALNREYANLQQIEVLKGPQGALYGRNASAGAFIITTKLPDEGVEGEVKVGYGEDDTKYADISYGGRLNETLLGSIQANYYDTDGFYTNDYLNRDDITDNQETWDIAGRLLFELGDKTTLDTKARIGEVDASSITFNSIFHIPAFVNFDPLNPIPQFNEDVNEHPFNFFNNVIHTNHQESLEFSAKLDHELEGATLTAWALYSDIENMLGADGTSAAFSFFDSDPACIDTVDNLTGFPLNSPQYIGLAPGFPNSLLGAYTPTTCDGTQFQMRNQKDYSFEVRLTSDNDSSVQWMTGIYYLNIEREVAVSTGIDNLNAPDYTGASVIMQPYTTDPSNPTEQLVWDRFDTDVYSAFAQIGWDVSDTVTTDLAIRYDREERKVRNKVPTPADGANPSFINPCIPFAAPDATTPINPGLCNGPIEPKKKNFSEIQPKLSVNWTATDNTSLFASWGKGFRSGGFNNQGSEATVDTFINNLLFDEFGNNGLCDPSVPGCLETGRSQINITDDYREETSTAIELGFKSSLLDGGLRLEGAIYQTDVDDMQFFEFIVGPFGLLRVVENIDDVQLRGIELAASWDATEWLDLYIGANFNDTEIKENNARPDTIGNDSPYTPDFTGSAGAYITLPVNDDYDFFANLNVSAIGKTWFHAVQDQTRPIGFELIVGAPVTPGDYTLTRRDAYELLNLRTGIETEQWTATLWVDNLTDEDYLEEVIPAPEFGGSFGHPGGERRAGAEFLYRF